MMDTKKLSMEVQIDKSVYECKRGIYGIMIIKGQEEKCAYIGKSEQVEVRANKHKSVIESGGHIQSLKDAYKDPKATIVIRALESVPYEFDNFYKDAQRLASAENRWIDKYQKMDQCLEQTPEGRRPSFDAWLKRKAEAEKK